jgi:CPA2 family monovalent cation:H+ antiporter-2
MLLNPGFLIDNLGVVSVLTVSIIVGKTIITGAVVAILGIPLRVALVVGLYLAQIGEFSLVLLTTARTLTQFPAPFDQMFLSITLVTMVASPFLALAANRVSRLTTDIRRDRGEGTDLSGHTVIVGYGLNGQNVATSLKAHGLKYAILEMNPQTVRHATRAGEPIYYGDAISETVQRHVGIQRAQSVVFAISDPAATRQGVATARHLNRDLYIIARTRYVSEIEGLYAAGADTVITEEFETSLEIIRRILARLGYRPSVIDREILNIRQRRYARFRGEGIEKLPIQSGTEFEPFEVEVRKKSSGKTLEGLAVREMTGATIIAVRSNSTITPNPSPNFVLQEGDHVYVIGSEDQIRRAMRLL